ncbi:MAG: serine--tRNA ligase [Pseudomonadales bacterium]|jgi:seryl-tRNA synthetase
MLDQKWIRGDLADLAGRLAKKGFELDVAFLESAEQGRKSAQTSMESLQSERNSRSKAIGQAKAKGEDIEPLLAEVATLGDRLEAEKARFESVNRSLQGYLATLPNLPDDDVPSGTDEADNVLVRSWGSPTELGFTPRDHVDLGAAGGGMDFDVAVKLSQSRFVVLRGELAKLQRALIQFMLDVHVGEHGYQEVYVPFIVNSDSLHGTGQLPKFAEDQFKIESDRELYLIPTAEVPVTNLYRDTITSSAELPIKLVCHSPCFRSEAGSYGRDTRGMIRQHQFEKVELVQLVPPTDSEAAHEALTAHAEAILQKLELPYRVVNLCGGDLGFSAAKTYDLEVWLPSQQAYREISSCSNFRDFQARRMQARMRTGDNKPELLHTLNGSGVAVGRALVAILENFQDEGGRVAIPKALQPYMAGATHVLGVPAPA